MPYKEQRDKENIRKLYVAYANLTRDADKAKFLTAQTIQEAGWDMAESGKNNFSGIKENDKTKGSLAKTTESFKTFEQLEKWITARPGRTFAGHGPESIHEFSNQFKTDKIESATDWFKDFDTVEDGLRGKVRLIEKHYSKAYNAKNIDTYLNEVQKIDNAGPVMTDIPDDRMTRYARDVNYKPKVLGVFTGKTLNKKVLGDLVEITRENLKNTRMESFYAQENLSKLANMTPAQAVDYHHGKYDKELAEKLAREKFARESVAGGSNQLDYEILGDITENADYYKFKFDAKTELPFWGDSKVRGGITTFSSKDDGYDPKTEIRAGFTKQLDKDTSIDIYGSKTNESGQLGFKFTSKY